MVNGSDYLQIWGGGGGEGGLQLIRGKIQGYAVNCGMITHFNMFQIADRIRSK